jgi:hypothetical protein
MTTRRRFLHATLGAAIGLPWLETFGPPSARDQAPGQGRFVVMFSPNGTVRDRWLPSGSEADFTLSQLLSPLECHKDELVIVSGVDQQGAGGDGNQNGIGGMVTVAGLVPVSFAGVGAPPAGLA